ncbi:MAG: OmpA family protein [Bacteroidota bacterium]|nr:OmpA family protein [Candidatus Kapabacteria bacterium]MDW8218930.1 OmpA family protein [Bacteroidota bacterium]
MLVSVETVLLAQPKKKIIPKMLQVQGVSVSKVEALCSPFRETNITLSPDRRVIYFMSERGSQPWSQFDEKLHRYDGDIWYAERKDGVWQPPQPLPTSINSSFSEDEPNLSPDGQIVLFQSFRSGWEEQGGPYFMAERKGKTWENIVGLGGTLTSFFINQSRDNNGSVATDGSSMSPTGTIFIFTCGKDLHPKTPHDIYIARRFLDGTFSQVERLEISTPKNERSVFIAADGKTLYFASNGYGGLGGLDIFKTTLNDDGTFGTLYNLGEPFNSKDDDYGFVLSADGKEAYFIRDGDIYVADLSQLDSRELKAAPVVLLTGTIKSKATGSPLEASIDISEIPAAGMEDSGIGGYSLTARSNSISGEYAAILKPGKTYMLSVSASKHKGTNKEFSLNAEHLASGTYKLDVELEPLPLRPSKTKSTTTSTVALKNASTVIPTIATIYFKTDDFTLEERYLDELDKVWEFLRANPTYQAEISGYADDRGSYEYNLRLSQRRVNAIADYLWSLGCERKRLALKFFGEEEPVANNLTAEGRSRNRRAEITFFRKLEERSPAAPQSINNNPQSPARQHSASPSSSSSTNTLVSPRASSPTKPVSLPPTVPKDSVSSAKSKTPLPSSSKPNPNTP